MKRLVFLPPVSSAPLNEVWIEGGRVLRAAPDAHAETTILVTPGALALTRWLDLPSASEAQARAAAAHLLGDLVASDRAHLHVALGPRGAEGRRLAAVVDRQVFAEWLHRAREDGVEPDVVIPTHLLLPDREEERALGLRIGDQLALRGKDLALTCEPDLAPVILGQRPYLELADPREIDEVLVRAAAAPELNMLQGEFALRKKEASGGPRPVLLAALAAVALAVGLAAPAVQAARYGLAASALDRAVAAMARQIAPNYQGGDPMRMLRQAAGASGRTGGDFSASAALVFASIEQFPGARLLSAAYAPGRGLSVKVSCADFAEYERVRAALTAAGARVEEGASRNEDGAVVGEMTVRAGS